MYLKAMIILLQGWLLYPSDRTLAKPLKKFGASNKIDPVVRHCKKKNTLWKKLPKCPSRY